MMTFYKRLPGPPSIRQGAGGNKRVSFVTHLIGAMRSISSHWGCGFTPTNGSSPIDQACVGEPGAQRILEAKEEIQRIEKAVAGDRILEEIFGGFRAGMSATEIREALELPEKGSETAMKRLRRRVRPTVGQGPNDA